MTPSDEEILDGAGRLAVWFPENDIGGNRIPETSRNELTLWFDSMCERAVHYAKIAQKYEKPILFGKFGCNFDSKRQTEYMSTVIELFSKEEWCYGFYWWKWDEQVPRPPSERWYPIKNRLSTNVIKEWSSKDRSRKEVTKCQ